VSAPRHARIPANVEQPDRILFNLTARQVGILTITAGVITGLIGLARQFLPTIPMALLLALAVPLAAAGLALAFGRRDGLGLDQLVWAAIRQARAPRRMVAAPEGVTAAPEWLTRNLDQPAGPQPAPLTLPATAIDPAGVLDLGADGAVLVCTATPVNLSLRTTEEQAVLVESFGRFLHSLTGPTQVLLRAYPVDLRAVITHLHHDATGLPHPALEAAAQAHAAFLAELAGRREALRRDLLVVFRDPTPGAARRGRGASLLRRAEEAAGLLTVAGVTLTVLDASQAAAVLASTPSLPGGGG
jgi:hypothetical protein